MRIADLLIAEVGTTYHTKSNSIKVVSSFNECDRALYIQDKHTGLSFILEGEILVNEDFTLEEELIQTSTLKISDPTLYKFIHPAIGIDSRFGTVKDTLNMLNKEKKLSEITSILKSMEVYENVTTS